jgi:hypothetical protein
MLLSINEAKVAELLQSNDRPYTAVFTSGVPMASENHNPVYPSYEAPGTVYALPVPVTADAREQFTALRKQIEDSGVPLKSAKELTREIDEMRGGR